MIKLSEKNSKLGKVLNVSLAPVTGCRPGVPCADGACYALKAYRMYKQTRAAWDHNLQLAMQEPNIYFGSLMSELEKRSKRKNKLFRWHVAGDILSPLYFENMVRIAHAFPEWRFLVFTKQYSIVNNHEQPNIPANLAIMFSQWPGLPMENPHNFPVAWYDQDNGSRCKAIDGTEKSCESCQLCWFTADDVNFPSH